MVTFCGLVVVIIIVVVGLAVTVCGGQVPWVTQSTARVVVFCGVRLVCAVATLKPAGWVAVCACAAACCTLAETLPEIVSLTPLAATVCSVGTTRAPPLPPRRPSNCAKSCASCPGGTG